MTEQEKKDFEREIREKIAEEQRAKVRKCRAKWREKNRERIRQYDKVYRSKHVSSPTKYDSRCKSIALIDSKGSVIKTFPSIAEASRQTDIHYSAISNCCRGLSKTAGGFKWRYVNE